ncbi:hypothetical protein SY91_01779 [Burkholderia cenocepacia]|nr:hypothetical protein SY91_01779 [Burkholderia cenocepacia]
MRSLPMTVLSSYVDWWWNGAQYRSPYSPEAIAEAKKRREDHQRAIEAQKRRPSYEQRLRAHFDSKRRSDG